MSGRNQRRTLGAGAMLSVVTLLWLPYALAASQAIESSIELEQGLPAKLADVQRGSKFSAQNLAGKSDVQLTQLTAQWGQLNPSQRRDLLAEVRRRMTLNKASAAAPKDGLKTGQKGGKVTIRVQRTLWSVRGKHERYCGCANACREGPAESSASGYSAG